MIFSTINRYVFRSFLSGYVILICVGIGLYILADLLINLDEFTDDPTIPLQVVLASIVDYYGYNIPLYYAQLSGPIMAIAAAFTLGIMLRNNELTALVAAGVPLRELAAPILYGVILLIGATIANRELVIPRVAHKIARSHDDATGLRAQSVRYVRDDRHAILTAQTLDRDGALRGVYIIEPASAGQLSNLIQADAARYDRARQTWILERGVRMRVDARGGGLQTGIARESVSEYALTLTPEALKLRQSAEWSDMMSLQNLKSLANSPGLPNRGAIVRSLMTRFTEPISQLVLVALAIPFFLTRVPGAVLTAGGRALLWTGLFFAVTFASRELATSVGMVQIAAGLPLIVFGSLAFLFFVNVKT